ncbi:hypothetical protein D3C86_1176980 [compost metagenome]
MAESIDDGGRGTGRADDGKTVRHRRAETHPLFSILQLQSGQETPSLLQHRLCTAEIRLQFQPAKFDRAADTDARRQRGDDKAMIVEVKLARQVESAGGKGGVVATFGFQRHDVAKRRGKLFRPGAAGDHHLVGIDLVAVFERHDRAFANGIDAFGFALAQARATGNHQIENSAGEIIGVGDLQAIGREYGVAELRRETGLQLFDFVAADALKGEARVFLFVPVLAGSVEACLTVVKIERPGF